MTTENGSLTLGWREWIALPELGVDLLKVKVDTGARTSALHTFTLATFERGGQEWVRFGLHPRQNDDQTQIYCEAPVFDRRIVRDSGGHEEMRPVIRTEIHLGDQRWPIEITLTSRDNMKFRMLLGRTALADDYLVAPAASYLCGKPR